MRSTIFLDLSDPQLADLPTDSVVVLTNLFGDGDTITKQKLTQVHQLVCLLMSRGCEVMTTEDIVVHTNVKKYVESDVPIEIVVEDDKFISAKPANMSKVLVSQKNCSVQFLQLLLSNYVVEGFKYSNQADIEVPKLGASRVSWSGIHCYGSGNAIDMSMLPHLCCIRGPNGSGKTILYNIMRGIYPEQTTFEPAGSSLSCKLLALKDVKVPTDSSAYMNVLLDIGGFIIEPTGVRYIHSEKLKHSDMSLGQKVLAFLVNFIETCEPLDCLFLDELLSNLDDDRMDKLLEYLRNVRKIHKIIILDHKAEIYNRIPTFQIAWRSNKSFLKIMQE